LEGDNLADEAARDVFALFWEAMALLAMEAFTLFPEVRLKSFFFYLSGTVVFMVTFLVVVINSYHQSIHVLEQDRFILFLGEYKILNLIWEPLVIVVVQNTILLT